MDQRPPRSPAADALEARGGARGALALLLVLGAAYWLLPPAVVNGDGLGYLRQVAGGELSPGHLAYLPLIRLLARLRDWRSLADLEPLLRGMSALCAVAALGLLFDAARIVHGARSALWATALLGLSHAFFRSATEVEVYAAAVLCATLTLWAVLRARRTPRAGWALLAGCGVGVATLFHLTLALLGPGVLWLVARAAPRERRLRHLLLAAGAGAVAAGGGLLLALHTVGHTTPAAAWGWLRSADHGIPYPHGWHTPLVALWGLARSLIHAPYPHAAAWWRVIVLSALAGAAWLALILLWRRERRVPPGTATVRREGRGARDLFLAWIGPLALFGVLFYPSDTERWLFVAPVLCLTVAPALAARPRTAGVLLLGVLLVNAVTVELPLTRDDGPRRRAAAVDQFVGPRDLVVSPGHGWDELVGFAAPRPARRFHLVFFVGAERGIAPAAALMHTAIQRTAAAGGRAFVARLHPDGDRQGFKELAWLGLPPTAFTALFERYRPWATPVPGLWALQLQASGPQVPRPTTQMPR